MSDGGRGAGCLSRGLAGAVILAAMVASLGLLPPAVAVHAATTVDPPRCETWSEGVVGPAERSLKPVVARWSDGEPLSSAEFGKLLEADDSVLRLSQPGRAMILDFGVVVSGKIELDVTDASGAAVIFSSSESLEFLSIGSDTRAYGNGDLVYRPSGGRASWHAFARRTFRYLLVSLAQPGWVDLDRIGLYFTGALGPASAFRGWFQSSDPLLNSIWYHSAYTLQLVTAAGSSTAADGTLEVWRGQLEMAAGSESRVLLARPGADWTDYTFDFELTLPPGSAGGGWAVRALPDVFLAFRLAPAQGSEPVRLQVWRGTRGGAAALVVERPMPLDVRQGRPYHVRVDAAGNQITTSIDRQVVSTEAAMGIGSGRVGFWAAAGDQFDVAHPRVYSASGALLFEDTFGGSLYPDPLRWEGVAQPFLLDGAKRDRSVGLADLAIAARAEYLSFGDWDWIGRQLVRIGGHQFEDGKVPGGLVGGESFAPEDARLPDYSFWWVLAVGDYVQQSGDMDTLEALFPRVQAVLAWADRQRQPDGLLPKGSGEDWYWSAQRGSGPTTNLNALYAGSLLVAADLANMVHRGDLHDRYFRQAGKVRQAINASLWDATVGAYVDGDLRDHHPLDGNALAVMFGVAEAERATRVLGFVHDQLWTPVGTLAADRAYGGWAQDDAIWPAYVYPEVEARFRLNDDANALELVRRTWGGMLRRDPASTFWEFATRDGGVHDGSTSLAHGWSTGALPALSRWILGVRPVRPGYSEYVISPHPTDIDWACGATPTPAGAIRTAWLRAGGNFTLWVDSPMGTSGRFVLPGDTPRHVLLDGQAVRDSSISATGPSQIDLPPGSHVVESVPATGG